MNDLITNMPRMQNPVNWVDASPAKVIIAQISGLVKTPGYSSLTVNPSVPERHNMTEKQVKIRMTKRDKLIDELELLNDNGAGETIYADNLKER